MVSRLEGRKDAQVDIARQGQAEDPATLNSIAGS